VNLRSAEEIPYFGVSEAEIAIFAVHFARQDSHWTAPLIASPPTKSTNSEMIRRLVTHFAAVASIPPVITSLGWRQAAVCSSSLKRFEKMVLFANAVPVHERGCIL
jgi:hypothetical protein